MDVFHDKQYLDCLRRILEQGDWIEHERTGERTISLFDCRMEFDLSDGTIPLLTTKKMFTKGILHELKWFLDGDTSVQTLKDKNIHIWDLWEQPDGSIGPGYGHQWRHWDTYEPTDITPNGDKIYVSGTPIDQIERLVHTLRTNPSDRRLIVSAWNVGMLDEMALPPCHYAFECYARPLLQQERVLILSRKYCIEDMLEACDTAAINVMLDKYEVPSYQLSLKLHQRSADFPLGVPFNIAQYSVLLHILCKATNMLPGKFIWDGGNCHIYENQVESVKLQLEQAMQPSPTITFLNAIGEVDDYDPDQVRVNGYDKIYPIIKYPVAK